MNKSFWLGMLTAVLILGIFYAAKFAANGNDQYYLAQDSKHSAGEAQRAEHHLTLSQGGINPEEELK